MPGGCIEVAACRICLSVNVRLLRIGCTPLQDVYEKLTGNSLYTAVNKPVAACYICYALLKKSHTLLLTATKAENLLKNILESESKITKKLIYVNARKANELRAPLVFSNYEVFDDSTHTCIPAAGKPCGLQHIIEPDSNDDNPATTNDVKTERDTEDSQSEKETDAQSEKEIDDIKSERDIDEDQSEMADHTTESLNAVIKVEDSSGDVMVAEVLKDIQPSDLLVSDEGTNVRKPVSKPKSKRRPRRVTTKPRKMFRYKNSISINDRSHYVHLGTHYTSKEEGDEVVYSCKSCGAATTCRKTIKQHVRETHLNVTSNRCPLCKVTVKENSTLKEHLSVTHGFDKVTVAIGKYVLRPSTKPSIEKPTKFECNICKLKYASKASFACHNRLKHQLHKCPECDIELIKPDLLLHRAEKHGVEKAKCGICGYNNYSETIVLNHQRAVHMKEKLVPCSKCDAKFFTKNELKGHMLRHNPVRNFECSYCGKKFLRKKNQQLHEKIHTGEKNKVCTICEARFVQKAALNYHMKRHHPETC